MRGAFFQDARVGMPCGVRKRRHRDGGGNRLPSQGSRTHQVFCKEEPLEVTTMLDESSVWFNFHEVGRGLVFHGTVLSSRSSSKVFVFVGSRMGSRFVLPVLPGVRAEAGSADGSV